MSLNIITSLNHYNLPQIKKRNKRIYCNCITMAAAYLRAPLPEEENKKGYAFIVRVNNPMARVVSTKIQSFCYFQQFIYEQMV